LLTLVLALVTWFTTKSMHSFVQPTLLRSFDCLRRTCGLVEQLCLGFCESNWVLLNRVATDLIMSWCSGASCGFFTIAVCEVMRWLLQQVPATWCLMIQRNDRGLMTVQLLALALLLNKTILMKSLSESKLTWRDPWRAHIGQSIFAQFKSIAAQLERTIEDSNCVRQDQMDFLLRDTNLFTSEQKKISAETRALNERVDDAAKRSDIALLARADLGNLGLCCWWWLTSSS
jgi:hypothetical protein